jgi:hypothetical protein
MRAFLVRGVEQRELWYLTAFGQDDRRAEMNPARCSCHTIFLPTFYEPGPLNTGESYLCEQSRCSKSWVLNILAGKQAPHRVFGIFGL